MDEPVTYLTKLKAWEHQIIALGLLWPFSTSQFLFSVFVQVFHAAF